VERQRDINRVMTPVIQNRMTTGYEACNMERGPGMYERMKSHMSGHITKAKFVMFNDASGQLRNQLDKLQVLFRVIPPLPFSSLPTANYVYFIFFVI